MRIQDLIGEATEYDKKQMVEEKRPKSWCKSVSAFANGAGDIGFEAPTYFIKTYIQPLIKDGKIKMTLPDKPKSKFQKYYS